jgi:hypothetical protein
VKSVRISAATAGLILLMAGRAIGDDVPSPKLEGPAAKVETPAPIASNQESGRCPAAAMRPRTAATPPTLVPFQISPFPYDGIIPADSKPFLDYQQGGERGHTSPRGRLHLEAEAYFDKRSLLYLPPGFDLSKPALIVVFFHGNFTRLQQDVVWRQRVPVQLAESGLNAALVAPQFAVDIADSSAGWFWQPGVFNRYLTEAAAHLAALRGAPCTEALFNRLGVVLVAYSGGYDPAAYALDVGGAGDRVRGVVLLDALYGESDRFERWVEHAASEGGSGFFFSAYSSSSRPENTLLQNALAEHDLKIEAEPRPLRLRQGSVTFLFAGNDIDHKDFVTDAWVRDPLKAVLAAIEGYRRPTLRVAEPPRSEAHTPRSHVPTPQPPVSVSPPPRAPQNHLLIHPSRPT